MIDLLVAILATWRIAVWLWYERTEPWAQRWPWIARQLGCFWCVTFLVGLGTALLLLLNLEAVLLPFALSGGALLLSGGGRLVWREIVSSYEGG